MRRDKEQIKEKASKKKIDIKSNREKEIVFFNLNLNIKLDSTLLLAGLVYTLCKNSPHKLFSLQSK